jgi:diguanylate cyclase (GGDEF)-like protein
MAVGGIGRGLLREVLAKRDDPYEGADLGTSRRIVGALWGLSAVLTLAFWPLDPPTQVAGVAGWGVAIAIVAASFAGARWLFDERRAVTFGQLLVVGYAGLGQIALLEWLAGGESSPYHLLYLLWLGAGGVHPPRRALPYLAALVGALSLPLAYHGYDRSVAADIAANALLLLALGVVLISYLVIVRRQRAGLRSGEERQRRLARVDPLTGLGNRRAFDEALAAEIGRAERDGSSLSVGLVDLDGLKQINDRWGHLEGDRCLRDVADAIRRVIRVGDRCFRWGGDEFAILLPGATYGRAERILERIGILVAASCLAPDDEPLEVSFGLAELDGLPDTGEVLALADLVLMEQKAAKRA